MFEQSFTELLAALKSDIYKYSGRHGVTAFIKAYILLPGFRFMYCWRITKYLKNKKVFKYTLYPFARLILFHHAYRFGFDIPVSTQIDLGFSIAHFGTIIINGKTKIGRNVLIQPGVLIGETNRGKNPGAPVIGNDAHIGAGCKIIGGVVIGNNVAIGANSVVTKSIPDNAVVVGIPGQIISYDGAQNFVVNRV